MLTSYYTSQPAHSCELYILYVLLHVVNGLQKSPFPFHDDRWYCLFSAKGAPDIFVAFSALQDDDLALMLG